MQITVYFYHDIRRVNTFVGMSQIKHTGPHVDMTTKTSWEYRCVNFRINKGIEKSGENPMFVLVNGGLRDC